MTGNKYTTFLTQTTVFIFALIFLFILKLLMELYMPNIAPAIDLVQYVAVMLYAIITMREVLKFLEEKGSRAKGVGAVYLSEIGGIPEFIKKYKYLVAALVFAIILLIGIFALKAAMIAPMEF